MPITEATVVEYAASQCKVNLQMKDGTTLEGVVVKSTAWQICTTQSATGQWSGCTQFELADVDSIEQID